jgi:hypothetical protein
MYESLTEIEISLKLLPGDIVWLDDGQKIEIVSKKGISLYPKYKYLVAILKDNTPKVK